MSNLFKYTKRVLTSVLAAAVVLTAIPSTAFGAELDEDLAIEVQDTEVAEAGEEVVVENEDALTTDGASSDEEVEAREEEETPDQAKADVTVSFGVSSYEDASHNPYNAGIFAYDDLSKNNPLNATGATATVFSPYAAGNETLVNVDSEKDYTFIIQPTEGYAFDLTGDKVLVAGSYVDYSAKAVGEVKPVVIDGTNLKVEELSDVEKPYYFKGSKKVTVSKAVFANVLAGKDTKDDTKDDGIFFLSFPTVATAAKWPISGFTLKDIEQDPEALPSDLELTNGTNKNLDLTKVLKCGSLNVASFGVHVTLFDKDGEILIDSGALAAAASPALDSDVDPTSITNWSINSGTDLKKKWALYKNDGTVLLSGKAITYAYNNDCSLIVDVTAGALGDVKVKTNTATDKVVTFTAAEAGDATSDESPVTYTPTSSQQTIVPKSSEPFNTADKTKDLFFRATVTSDYTYINSVTWTIDGESDDSYKATVPARFDNSGPLIVRIPAADLAGGDVVVSATGAYDVSKKTDDSQYSILDLDGNAVTQAEAGQDFKFQIAPVVGVKINSVTYQVGGGDSKSIRPTGGVFTIPKKDLTGDVTILPSKSSSGAGDAIVRLADTYGAIDVYKLDESGRKSIDKAGIAATMGEPIHFVIEPNGEIIEKVSYTMGTSTNVVITPAYGKTYEIPAVSDTEVVINITYRSAGEVYAPFNDNVTVDFAKNGEKVTLPTGAFSFTVTPKSSNIKVTKIYYNDTNNNDTPIATLPGTDGGTIDVVTGTKYIYVETEEAVPETDFRAVFTDSTDPTLIETTYETGKPKNILNIKEQALKLVLNSGEQTIATAIYPVKNGKLYSEASMSKEITAPETTDILTLNKAAVKITPKKGGNQDVVITGKNPEAYSYGNTFVYNGTLKVSVKQPYTDLEIIADENSAYTYAGNGSTGYNSDNLDYVGFTLTGNNGQTGDREAVNVDGAIVKQVAWSFVPSTDQVKPANWKYSFDNSSTGHAFAVASGASGASGATAYVTAKEAGAVTVKAVITYKDGSEEEVTKTINFIDPLTKEYFLVGTVSGCKDAWNLLTGTSKINLGTLGLNTDSKSFTVKYDVYSIEDPALNVAMACSTKAGVEEALKNKQIAKVENAVFGEAKLVNAYVIYSNAYVINKKDTTAYASLSGNASNGYTITALKSNEGQETTIIGLVAPTITIDGVIVPELNANQKDVYFDIDDKVDNYKVELITIDDQSKNAAGTARLNQEQALTTTYINGRDYSVVKDSTDPRNVKNIGIEFNSVGNGTFITLPKESDLDASKMVAKKTLLGWALAAYDPDGPGAVIKGSGVDTAETIYNPGAAVQVTGNVSFKAIYADKYVTYTGTAGDSSGQLIYLYDNSKSYVDDKGETKYPVTVPLSTRTIEIGDDVPVVIGVGRVDGFSGGDAYDVVLNAVDVDELTVKEEFYQPSDFTLTAKGADSTALLDATELGKGSIKAKSDTTRTGVDATITVTWKDKERTADEYKEDKAVRFAASTAADDSVEMAKVGDSSWISSDDTATINEGATPVSLESALVDSVVDGSNPVVLVAPGTSLSGTKQYYYNYSYVWTSSKPAVATVEAGKEENQGTATLTPLSAGTTTIKLSVLKSGKEIASDEFELTVTASDVVLTFADNEGHTGITQVEAHAAASNTGVFKVKATDKSGKAITGGKFVFGTVATTYDKNKVIASSQWNAATGAGDASGFTSVNITTKDFIGTDVLHVVFENTVSGKKYTYQKDINVKTYYSITLAPISNTWITVNGVKQANADGTNKPVEIKLFEEDMKDVAENAASKVAGKVDPLKKKNFNFKGVSLNGYSAIYNDGTATEKEFSNWKVPGDTATSPSLKNTEYKENDTIKSLIGYSYVNGTVAKDLTAFGTTTATSGTLTLAPEVVSSIKAAGVPGQVTMNYKASDAVTVGASKFINKKVSFTIEPVSYATELTVVGEKRGFYSVFDDADHNNAGQTVTPSSGKTSFVIAAYEDYDPDTKTTWKAGTDKVSIYGPNKSTALATVTLDINGLNYDESTKKVQYFENGQTIKSDYKTVDGNTYYFDAEGNWIETTGITKINGKSVLIVNGVVAPKGKNVYEGNTYFVGDNGVILTGWLTSDGAAATAANGVYYADPAADGKLVSGLQTIDGKKFFFTSDNKKAVASASANLFENVSGTDYYVNAAGDIAMNGIFKVAGIDRLFKEDGKIVTYADTTDGKIKVGNITYVIDKVTNEAKPDKKMVNAKFNWTTKKPAKFDRKSSLPTSDWEIKYNLEGETTEQKVTGTVTAVADPADYATNLNVKKVTFTFTASESDLAGYFSDSKGEKALTATPAVWTYTFNGEIGTGGGIEIDGFEEGQEFKFTGGAIKPPVEVWDNDLGEKLVLGVDYSLSYKNNTKITTDSSKMPTLTVVGKGNYAGKNVTRTFKIVNPIEGETGLTTTVKKVELGFTTTPVYNGEAWYPDTITVDGNKFQHSSGDTYTTEGTANYVFTFSGNVDAGTATVGVTGQDGKTKKKTFKINKVDFSKVPTANLEISPADAEWTVKGAVPATTVTYTPEGGSAITLVEGQDYTLKVNYADKKKNVAEGNTVTITGKGANFSKKATSTETFAITPYTITDDNLLEVVAPAGAKVKAVKTTVVDKNGVKIDKKNFAAVNVYDSTSTLLAPTASLTAGQTYKVEVVAPPTGNIDGSASFEFIAAADMSKAKVTLSKDLKKNGVAYTGEPIDVTKIQSGELIKNLFTTGDITVEYKNPSTKKYEKLTWDEDFEVVGYQNNVKKGTMTVYIRAKDDSTKVSGVKNFKIKISAKTMKKAD